MRSPQLGARSCWRASPSKRPSPPRVAVARRGHRCSRVEAYDLELRVERTPVIDAKRAPRDLGLARLPRSRIPGRGPGDSIRSGGSAPRRAGAQQRVATIAATGSSCWCGRRRFRRRRRANDGRAARESRPPNAPVRRSPLVRQLEWHQPSRRLPRTPRRTSRPRPAHAGGVGEGGQQRRSAAWARRSTITATPTTSRSRRS
jgi:hypothetical protein